MLIGLEREAQQKSAGTRTYSLVGVGSALFVLISKYGFTDVLQPGHVVLDPSRVAAQIVTGLGFIGGGLIFVRRDAVRGLTTAASVWLTAAIGAAAGAGLPVLAIITTTLYFVVQYALRPLTRAMHRIQPDTVGLRVTYLDGRGLLREIVNLATGHGFALLDLTTTHSNLIEDHERDDRRDRQFADSERPPATVDVALVLSGRGDLPHLQLALSDVDGILGVRSGSASIED
jgi:putative Mg2+ transporter-C (MgtC) family protein